MQECHTVLVDTSKRRPLEEIEKSITKTYRKDIFRPFVEAIEEFQLLKAGDKIGVALSGGKDSLLLAKLFQEIKKHNKYPFDLVFISMDPGYAQENVDLLISNTNYLNIPLQIFKSEIFKVAQKIASDHPCYLCARMRRGFLYKAAKDLGCNKLALGHHFDDVIETTLMNIFYNGTFKTMVPKIKAENFEDIELIRPMIKIKEKDIIRWANKSGIQGMNCGCTVTAKKTSSKRREIKKFIEQLRLNNPNIDIDSNIYRAAFNVNLEAIMGYHNDDIVKDFNDIYEGRHKK
jgi:tRNA 2-thiocytidine biosynthesis protein TtcA